MNLKLCCKQYDKINLWHLIVVPQLSRGWQHNYSTETRQAGCANEQSMYSLMSMDATDMIVSICVILPRVTKVSKATVTVASMSWPFRFKNYTNGHEPSHLEVKEKRNNIDQSRMEVFRDFYSNDISPNANSPSPESCQLHYNQGPPL